MAFRHCTNKCILQLNVKWLIKTKTWNNSYQRNKDHPTQCTFSRWHCWSGGSRHPAQWRQHRPGKLKSQHQLHSCKHYHSDWTCILGFLHAFHSCSLQKLWWQTPLWRRAVMGRNRISDNSRISLIMHHHSCNHTRQRNYYWERLEGTTMSCLNGRRDALTRCLLWLSKNQQTKKTIYLHSKRIRSVTEAFRPLHLLKNTLSKDLTFKMQYFLYLKMCAYILFLKNIYLQ